MLVRVEAQGGDGEVYCRVLCVLSDQDVRARGVGFLAMTVCRASALVMRTQQLGREHDGTVLYCCAEVLVTLGGILNVTRFPERMFPGRLDNWCNSHQFMHILTGTAVLVHLAAVEKVRRMVWCGVLFAWRVVCLSLDVLVAALSADRPLMAGHRRAAHRVRHGYARRKCAQQSSSGVEVFAGKMVEP